MSSPAPANLGSDSLAHSFFSPQGKFYSLTIGVGIFLLILLIVYIYYYMQGTSVSSWMTPMIGAAVFGLLGMGAVYMQQKKMGYV